MKKSLKILLVAVLMLVSLLILTGCGNKLVATKETEESGVKYEEKMEITFKNDKVNKVKATFKFDNKDDAKKFADSYNGLMAMAQAFSDEEVSLPTCTQKGKKVLLELDAKEFAEIADEDTTGMTKEEVKESLEEQGYKVK